MLQKEKYKEKRVSLDKLYQIFLLQIFFNLQKLKRYYITKLIARSHLYSDIKAKQGHYVKKLTDLWVFVNTDA